MAMRLSIRGAEQDPVQIARIGSAYARLRSVPDDRGYDFFASLHGLSAPIWCEHDSPLFLPWHRAYLYYFELALQGRLGQRFTVMEDSEDPDLATVGIPWWDWTSAESHLSGIPRSYADPNGPLNFTVIETAVTTNSVATGVWSPWLLNIVRNHPNLNHTITLDDPPRTLRDPGQPADLPTQAHLDDMVMNENTFDGFSGKLEDVHNSVHGWVGGAMSQVPVAAYDPIFWSHHAMIDRLWYMWQISRLGEDPPAEIMNRVLAPFPMTVADTLKIANLRYDYAVQAIV